MRKSKWRRGRKHLASVKQSHTAGRAVIFSSWCPIATAPILRLLVRTQRPTCAFVVAKGPLVARLPPSFIRSLSQPAETPFRLPLSSTFADTKDALEARERREGAQPRNSGCISEGRRLRSDVTLPGQSGMGTAAGSHLRCMLSYCMQCAQAAGEANKWLAWQALLEWVEPRGRPSASSRSVRVRRQERDGPGTAARPHE